MIVVGGTNCETDPFAELFAREQTDCGKILETLTASGVSYRLENYGEERIYIAPRDNPGAGKYVAIAPLLVQWMARRGARVIHARAGAVYGFDFFQAAPAARQHHRYYRDIAGAGDAFGADLWFGRGAFCPKCFRPVSAIPRLSIPYHIGAGYLGGFLPLIAGVIVASTGGVSIRACGIRGPWLPSGWSWRGGASPAGRRKILSMIDAPPPPLRLSVDARALAANWRALDALSGAARAGAAVKADCYGLGVDSCVPVLRDAELRRLFFRRPLVRGRRSSAPCGRRRSHFRGACMVP